MTVVLREMRWWDIDPVLELEKDLFPDDAWSRGMFWSELAHARGPGATRRYAVAEVMGVPRALEADGADRASGTGGAPGTAATTETTGPSPAPENPGTPRTPRPRLVGYAGLAAAGDLGDIQTIAVARDHWSTGLGSLLLAELLRAATDFECAEVMLECRVDNVRAQKLYERFGFQPIGFRRGYYQPGNVDALVMRLTDPSTSLHGGQGTEIHG